MKNFYTGLKARIVAKNDATGKRIKFVGKWNSQLEKLKHGEMIDFQKPAVFFEFVSPLDVNAVGGGVQVFDPVYVKVHVLHEFYNDKDTGTSINLDVYDVAQIVHGWLQGYSVKGSDYGSSDLNKTSVDEDTDHDQIYHYAATYTTTWTDNSTPVPEGGYEIPPPLDAAITGGKLTPDVPSITASVSSLSFGNVTVGQSASLTFTIEGAMLPDTLIISSTNGQFLIALSTIYKTRILMSTVDEAITLTKVHVKFTPTSTGAKTGSILYGVPGINGEITMTGTGT